MLKIPLDIIYSSLIPLLTYSHPEGRILTYSLSNNNLLNFLCACVVIQEYKHESHYPNQNWYSNDSIYIGTLWLIDLRICEVIGIHSLNNLSYTTLCYMQVGFYEDNIYITTSHGNRYEEVIPFKELTLTCPSITYEKYITKFFNEYSYYLRLLSIINKDTHLSYAYINGSDLSMANDIDRTHTYLLSLINNLPYG